MFLKKMFLWGLVFDDFDDFDEFGDVASNILWLKF